MTEVPEPEPTTVEIGAVTSPVALGPTAPTPPPAPPTPPAPETTPVYDQLVIELGHDPFDRTFPDPTPAPADTTAVE